MSMPTARGPATDATPMAWASARVAAYAAAEPLPARRLVLGEALGATLAEPMRAPAPLPAFESAAMDGYAVGSIHGPWRVVGEVLAGDADAGAVAPGEAKEIATGAPVPAGTVASVRLCVPVPTVVRSMLTGVEPLKESLPKPPTTVSTSVLMLSASPASPHDRRSGNEKGRACEHKSRRWRQARS